MIILDLSFNRITKIEGFETLTNLVELNLEKNEIEVIERLERFLSHKIKKVYEKYSF